MGESDNWDSRKSAVARRREEPGRRFVLSLFVLQSRSNRYKLPISGSDHMESGFLFLLAPSFNPLSGTVRAFGQRAGLRCLLLTSALRSGRLTTSPVPEDTVQISRSKPDSLHRTPAGFPELALDGYGLCDILPARPTSTASYPVSVRRVATLLHASLRRFLAVPPLRFASASPPSGCTGDFHPQTVGHVRHTVSLFEPPPKAAAGLTSPCRPDLWLPSVRRPEVPTASAASQQKKHLPGEP
jgi:hypothetical protein